MTLQAKMRDKQWILNIDNEVWEFKDLNQIQSVMVTIMKLKESYGKIQEYQKEKKQ
tara:strand:- start:1125 stop:1292 length:168 start_codon:yes stop_codon:yes gene_type:complete